ncbi:MAG: FG-GAP repeat protein, partial [Planctomycetes bacterium]|nr:FG-GAP repeat protein [Planctomycetota bacterium]
MSQNVGQQPLTITAGSFMLPVGYTLVTPPGQTTLSSGQATSFAVQLTATLPGTFSGEIGFLNSDADEGSYNFSVTGTVLPTRILDDGQSGYGRDGDFQTSQVSIARDGDVGYVVGGASPSEATWTFNVPPGVYRVAATWFDTAGSSFYADNAPFTIFDGDAPVASVLANQRLAPDDFSDAGSSWEYLGAPVFISGSMLTVRLTNADANGYVLADAIRIEWIAPLVADIVDVSPDPRNIPVESVTIQFSEEVTGVDPGDFSLTLDGSPLDSSAWSLTVISGSEYVLNISPVGVEGVYVLTLMANDSSISDATGNVLRTDAIENWTIDTTPPTARFFGFIDNPREVPLSQLAVVFSEEVSGFGAQHLRLSLDGEPVDLSAMIITQVSPVSYQLRLSDVPQAANGDYVLTFDPTPSPITDQAGNAVEVGFRTAWLKLPVTVPITDVENYVLHGIAEDDQFGISVNGAGDVNGDGFDDLVIGARSADSNSGSDTGAAFLIFGEAHRDFALDVANLDGQRGVVLEGTATGDNFSWSVASAGDFDSDGIDDLLIGANLASPNGIQAAGEVYLIYGRHVWPERIDVSALNANDGFTLRGLNLHEGLGTAVAGGGDANGDGYSDILIGAPWTRFGENRAGAAYLIFGRPRGAPPLDLANLSSDGVQLRGQNFGDAAGQALAFAGDVNRDGLDDLLVGAPYADPNNQNNAGTTYLVFGQPVWPTTLSLAELGASGVAMHGVGQGVEDNSGYSVDSAGDLNGDGYADIVIGAPGASSNGDIDGGRTFVVLGAASLPAELELGSLSGANGFVLNGVRYFDESGHSVGPAGDIDGDGLDDLLIGAPGAFRPEHRGGAYVVFGRREFPATINLVTFDGNTGFAFASDNGFDFFGSSVGLIGDMDGDGLSDVAVGAPAASSWAGEAHVVVGADFRDQISELGTILADHLTGTSQDDRLLGAQGDDLLEGLGGADVLYGGQGNDTLAIVDLLFERLAGGNGFDTLRLDATGLDLDLTAIADTRITGIERIDLGVAGSNRLTLSRLELLQLSGDSNTLVVDGGADDRVTVLDGVWTDEGVVDGYRVYTLG